MSKLMSFFSYSLLVFCLFGIGPLTEPVAQNVWPVCSKGLSVSTSVDMGWSYAHLCLAFFTGAAI